MNNYEYGFITKCAEYGVDPNALIKFAEISITDAMSTVKGTASETAEAAAKIREEATKAIEAAKTKAIEAAKTKGNDSTSKLLDQIKNWGSSTWSQTKANPKVALLSAAGGAAATSLIAGILAATRNYRIKKKLRRKTQAALQEGRDLSNEDLQALLAAKGLI